MKKTIHTIIISFFSAVVGVLIYTTIVPKSVTIIEHETVYGRQVNNINQTGSDTQLNFVAPANKARPAVVYIKAKTPKSKGTFQKDYNISNGSGVIISSDGYIVSNSHVVGNAEIIEVTLDDNREFLATVISKDPMTDLALIKIEANNLIALEFGDSDQLEVGEWVLAIGNPFKLKSTITAGIVSAKARNINILEHQRGVESFIQTDAAVNPGNSGGALINTSAELVGINTAILSRNGAYEGFSFAIPSNLVKKIVYDMKTYGGVQRAWMGISIRTVDATLAKSSGLDKPTGVYVDIVNSASGAQDAGLKTGDIILSIDHVPTDSKSQLTEKIAQYRPGDIIRVAYLRAGEMKTTKLTLKNQINTTDFVALRKDKILTDLGFELRDLDRFEKETFGSDGVKVVSIYTNSVVGKNNMEVGYVIQSLNGMKVTTVTELIEIIKQTKGTLSFVGIYENYPGVYPYSFEK